MARPIFLASPNKMVQLANDILRLQADEHDIDTLLLGAPLLDDWGVGPPVARSLNGAVSGHPIIGHSPYIQTSTVYIFGADLTWARTLNRFYRLGSKAVRT